MLEEDLKRMALTCPDRDKHYVIDHLNMVGQMEGDPSSRHQLLKGVGVYGLWTS